MIKSILTTLITVFLVAACSSAGQMQSSNSNKGTDGSSASDDMVASWYDHTNKAYSDSTEFVGLGMAVAADSSEAMEVSMSQASANLGYSIDSYAENIRRELADDADENGVSSGSFIQSLRSAVNGLQFSESDLSETVEYEMKENGAVIAYSKVSVRRHLAIDRLASSIDNNTFSSSLRESLSLQ